MIRIASLFAFTLAPSLALAEDAENHENTLGVELALTHAPGADEVAGGALVRFTHVSDGAPAWLVSSIRFGMTQTSNATFTLPLLFGTGIGHGDGPFARLELGAIAGKEETFGDAMEGSWDVGVAGGATVGVEYAHWQLSATALYTDYRDQGAQYMVTLGRDFATSSSTTTTRTY